ncbi:hypothetical protein Tco_0469727 [Tanacetum coccineum]
MDNLIENLTNTLALLTQSYKTYPPQTNNQLRTSSNTRNQATVQDGRVVVQNVQGRLNRGQGNNARGVGATGYGELKTKLGMQIQCDAFDSNVNEAPTAQTMLMANISSTDLVYDEASPSYDLDILSEDLIKMKVEALKEHTTASRQIKALTITRAKHIEQTTALLTENRNLKAQIHENLKCITRDSVKLKVLAPGRYAIDVEPIPSCYRNNREVHLNYVKHLKESVDTLREIVEEVKVERPLDRSLASACLYTKHSQELLAYVIGTCLKDFNKQDEKHASTPLTKKKQVTFKDQFCTDTSGSQPRSNTKKNRISLAKSVNKKKVEAHPRTNKSSLKTTNRVDSSINSKRTVINSNSHSVCKTCNKCLISVNPDICVVNYLHYVNASPSVKNVVRKVKQV